MTHTYKLSGMTCSGCEAKVKHVLSKVAGVKNVTVDLSKGETTLKMDQHVATTDLQSALGNYPKYKLVELPHQPTPFETTNPAVDAPKFWLQTYKPILLVFAYLVAVTGLVEAASAAPDWMRWMQHFMAGFFLVFSFFKLLDLKAFAESYATYDIIAKNWRSWGYVYGFIELGLGIAYLTGFHPPITNAITILVMSLSVVGVIQSVTNKRKIRCACLGAVFNLPMSTITIIEDALMIIMSLIMLIKLV